MLSFFLEASTYSLKKPNSAKSVGTLAISLDPMPYREVLTDSPTSGLSAISKTTAQATAEVEKSAEFYRQFKVVLEYLDKVMIITDKLASVCCFPETLNAQFRTRLLCLDQLNHFCR